MYVHVYNNCDTILYVHTFCKIALVNETRNNVAVLKIEIVEGTKDVGWDDTSEHAAMLLVVSPTHTHTQQDSKSWLLRE